MSIADDRRTDDYWASALPFPARNQTAGLGASSALSALLRECGYAAPQTYESVDPGILSELAADCDLLILALERPNLRLAHSVNRVCLRHNTPWLLCTLDGSLGFIGPLFLPPRTACYNDFATFMAAAAPGGETARRYRLRAQLDPSPCFFIGLPAHADIVAGHAAQAATHFLARGSCFAAGRVMVVDLEHMRFDIEDLLRLPRCPVCRRHHPAYQPPFSAEVVTKADQASEIPAGGPA